MVQSCCLLQRLRWSGARIAASLSGRRTRIESEGKPALHCLETPGYALLRASLMIGEILCPIGPYASGLIS
jgi:hypothetical protein